MTITTRAALAAPGEKKFHIAEISVATPQAHEVLVRIVAVGMCHTDLVVKEAWAHPSSRPIVLGHEGAGVVEQVGAEVKGVTPGDRVLISFSSCGHCSRCRTGHPSYCDRFDDLNMNMAGALRDDGTSGLALSDGRAVAGGFFGQSSFAGYALANDRNVLVVDVDNEDDLAQLAPFGCAVQTGAGAILNEARPNIGDTVAVFGTGAVGLSALMATALTPAANVVAVDIVSSRLKLATSLGATHTVNSAEENVVDALTRISGGDGIHVAVDTSGVPAVQRQIVEVLAARGTLGIIGLRSGTDFAAQATDLLKGRCVRGITEGGSDLYTFLPALVALHRANRLPVDKLIQQYPLEQIDDAAEDSLSGATVKPVLRM